MNSEYSTTIENVCDLISEGNLTAAKTKIRKEYPFTPIDQKGRNYTPRMMTEIFIRDGFIDRYRGTKLVYPPALRVISLYLPEEFPYHKNGKMDLGHMAYWELFPTIDHVIPVARGGNDSEDNWVCCSMLTNSIKSNWTVEQLQWELLPPGNIQHWDGMIIWFINQVETDPNLQSVAYLKRWFNAAKEIAHNTGLQSDKLPATG